MSLELDKKCKYKCLKCKNKPLFEKRTIILLKQGIQIPCQRYICYNCGDSYIEKNFGSDYNDI